MAGAEGLPSDLLGEIYRRCASASPYDRARFASVCTSWRAVASSYPKLPALPLLLPSTDNPRRDLPTQAYSPEDDRVMRAPLPRSPPRGMRIVGSYDGGWVAATVGSQVVVVNLFTRAEVPLSGHFACSCPTHRRTGDELSIEKIIFSKDPTSKGCILAAITTGRVIGLCNPRSQNLGWTTRECESYFCEKLIDIAFCNGELYGLSHCTLYRLVLGRKRNGAPIVTSIYELTTGPTRHAYAKYVFQLCGKLTIAVEIRNDSKTQYFRIFKLATYLDKTAGRNKSMWDEVASLGDNALFLGPGCCKAVHVSAVGKRGTVGANCIYYSSPDVYMNCSARLDLGSCDVYCRESDVHPSYWIMSRGYHYRDKDGENNNDKEDGNNSQYSCTWVLPPDF